MMSRFAVCALVSALPCFAVGTTGVEGKCVAPQPATDAKFAPGQIWSYRSNPGEEGSTLTVLRVETLGKDGIVVHVRLDGIHFRNCHGDTLADSVAHAPFARKALEASVLKQIGDSSTLPAYEDGYQDWLVHCGGVYTIPVAKMVALDEAQYRAAFGCQ